MNMNMNMKHSDPNDYESIYFTRPILLLPHLRGPFTYLLINPPPFSSWFPSKSPRNCLFNDLRPKTASD